MPDIYRFADVEVNFERYEAKKKGELIEMSPREFEMLKLFAIHESEIVTRDMFLQEVWGYDTAPTTRTVDNFVAKLRQAHRGRSGTTPGTSSPSTAWATNSFLR